MNFTAFLSIVATMFLLLFCGCLCKKWHIIDDVASGRLSALIIKVGQPALIVSAMLSAPYSLENLRLAGYAFLLGCFLHLFMAIIAYIFCKPIRNMEERKILEFATVFTNCGFMGFPLLEALMPGRGLFLGAFYMISFQLFIWSWGVAILARKRDDIRLTPWKILVNFGSVPSLIGFLLFLLRLPFPDFVMPAPFISFFSYLGGLCTPVSMLITGALIASYPAKAFFSAPRVWLISACKLLILPFCVFGITFALGLPTDFILLATVEAALPSASTVVMMGEAYHVNPTFAARVVGISSLLSVATMPLIIYAAQSLLRV